MLTNLPVCEFVDNYEDFWNIIDNDSYDNQYKIYENDEICILSYTQKDIFEDNKNDVNIFVAEFTTANARLRLYDVLDKLGEQVVGFDTDSVWYLEGEKSIKTGDKLGEMTDELGDGVVIDNWATTGPKSYSYSKSNGEMVCKQKGFDINCRNSEKINMENMIKLVKKELDEIVTVNEKKITRSLKEGKILNVREEKRLKMTCSKRVTLKNYDSVPYGY